MKKLAEEIYKWMSNLKGPWIVHEDSFLPANICCDFAGSARFINELTEIIKKYQTKNCDFEVPIIGQEAVVPEYGLGKVISFRNNITERLAPNFVEVKPYACDYSMKFDPKNVRLVKIFFEDCEKHKD